MLLVFGTCAVAQTTFGPGPGESYGFATPTGHGGAASPYVFTSHISANVPQTWTVGSIESLSIRGLQTTSAEGLTFALSNGTEIAVMVQGAESGANLSGDYTFVNDPNFPTIREASVGLASSQLLTPGTYRMEGGILIFGNAGNMEDWTHFEGTRIWPGWSLLLLNQSTTHAGSFEGWTIDVNVNAVPEPGTLLAIGGALAALAGLRRRSKA